MSCQKTLSWGNSTKKSLKNMESQNVEYKQSWKDDYLKWICGFAHLS